MTRRAQPDPAGTGGVRCTGTQARAGCGQPVRAAWLSDPDRPGASRRVLVEPGPDPAGPWAQVGTRAGAPLLRPLRAREIPPAGAKLWMPHAASCTAGRTPVRRPAGVQLAIGDPTEGPR